MEKSKLIVKRIPVAEIAFKVPNIENEGLILKNLNKKF